MADLSGKRVLVLAGDEYEDLELWYPKLRVEEAGALVTVAGLMAGETARGKHGYPCRVDSAVVDLDPANYAGLMIPGGWMPDKLRRDASVLRLTRHFAETGKVLASICHGPWIMISAGICRGVRMTSTPGIRDDLLNAGALWVDEPVVVDRHFVTSRRPSDLPAFGAALVARLAESRR